MIKQKIIDIRLKKTRVYFDIYSRVCRSIGA